MMRILIAGAAALLMAGTAAGQEADLSTFPCGEYIRRVSATPPDSPQAANILTINTFLLGYASAGAGSGLISRERAVSFMHQLRKECDAEPSQTILQGATKAGAKVLKP